MNYLKTFLPYLFGNKKGKSLEFLLPDSATWSGLSFEEQLMFHALSNSLNAYVSALNYEQLSRKEIFHLFNFLSFLKPELRRSLEERFHAELSLWREAAEAQGPSREALQELLSFKTQRLTVFAILHHDRTRPGLLLVKKENGEFVTDRDGSIWSIPVLGLSGRGLPFHHSNGQTPMGVYTLDSVMPEANKPYEFGKFRRIIVNFIPSSLGEAQLLEHLPPTHHSLNWWKQSLVARELGRSLLRIHGTGRVNRNIFSPYFPFVPTSGCLATNEASFFGLKQFCDQRLLLDVLMKASGLEPIYENESKIHGLLYVVEFDDTLSSLLF